jgi:CRISPR/Cas system-associated exonuclease Cas4 (RecB family)
VRTELGHPLSAEIKRLSPSSFEVLHECSLRVAFAQDNRDGRSRGSTAARLGSVCHAVLDKAVRNGLLEQPNWRGGVERLWDAELAYETDRAVAVGLTEQPKKWPGYQLKRARLLQVAERVRTFLTALPGDAEVRTEESLTADHGRLYGRPDLIIRSSARHQIIDYKSGAVVERETNRPRQAYVRQLQLYAYLEHEATGSWPTTAHLFPLQGAPVEIEVDPQVCSQLAKSALDALDTYNAAVPQTPPPSPAPEHCRWCPYAVACASFWEECDETWSSAVLAVAGLVTRVFATQLGGVTAELNVEAGSIADARVVIKNIDAAVHADAGRLRVGDGIAVVGLLPDERGAGYRVASGGLVATGRGHG